jgi:hypothetical protein
VGELTDALLTAPVGVALLGRLEARHLLITQLPPMGPGTAVASASSGGDDGELEPMVWPFSVPDASSAESVAAAVAAVRAMSLADLLALAVDVGYASAGPWTGDGSMQLTRAYRDAHHRRALADAVAEKLAPLRDEQIELACQQWWHTDHRAEGWFATRRLLDLDSNVYGNGEFTHGGVWTVTDPPEPKHGPLASAWELDDPPLSRWAMPIAPDARVFEVRGPDDWVALVERYPKVAVQGPSGWELPGPNQYHVDQDLEGVSHGRAMRTNITRHVLPQWTRVAEDYDGVHLTWLGWLTTEGLIVDLPSGGVTMLRYWFSERTLWLRDVFGEPQPLPGPSIEHVESADVTTDETRRAQDREVLRAMLGRQL